MPLLKTTNYPQHVIYVFPILRFFLDPSSSTCLILRHSVTGSDLIGGCLSPSSALDVKGAREVTGTSLVLPSYTARWSTRHWAERKQVHRREVLQKFACFHSEEKDKGGPSNKVEKMWEKERISIMTPTWPFVIWLPHPFPASSCLLLPPGHSSPPLSAVL